MKKLLVLMIVVLLFSISTHAIAQTDDLGRPKPVLPADQQFITEKVFSIANKYVVSIEGIMVSTTSRLGSLGSRIVLEQQSLSRSVVSGIIISSDGLILTQARGIQDAKEVWVYFSPDIFKNVEDRKVRGKVIFLDMHYDIAAVRVDTKKLPVAKVADPSMLAQGDSVVAIGNSGPSVGLGFSVAYGIVSALRSFRSETNQFIPNMIQTDVMINPGNEGGPIFNWKGEFVGVHQIFPQSRGMMQGVTFFMPAEQAVRICKEIDKTKKNGFRPFVGIFFANRMMGTQGGAFFAGGGGRRRGTGVIYDDEFKMFMDMPDQYWDVGILIEQLYQGSPGYDAGLRREDVIVRMKLPWDKEFKYVRSAIEVEIGINQCKEKDIIVFGLIRDRRYREIAVTIGNHPKEYMPSFM